MSDTTTPSYPWAPIDKRPQCCEAKPFLEADGLSLSYRDKKAFDNVSLTVNRGCLTALVGPSGCGKTSFLTSLNRLTDMVPGCQVTGTVRLLGENIYSPSYDVRKLRKRIGMIFQKPNPFPLSIRKNITFPLKEHGVKMTQALEETTQDVLTRVGLWQEVKDRLDTPALALSGGQQQRLCIARAMALKPEMLLMDEPCSALDPISSGVVEDLILELKGMYTVLIVTHNLAQARRIADYVGFFWVQDQVGCLVEYGTGKQVFETPRHPLTASYISGIRG